VPDCRLQGQAESASSAAVADGPCGRRNPALRHRWQGISLGGPARGEAGARSVLL